jgi:hypothetical protein
MKIGFPQHVQIVSIQHHTANHRQTGNQQLGHKGRVASKRLHTHRVRQQEMAELGVVTVTALSVQAPDDERIVGRKDEGDNMLPERMMVAMLIETRKL